MRCTGGRWPSPGGVVGADHATIRADHQQRRMRVQSSSIVISLCYTAARWQRPNAELWQQGARRAHQCPNAQAMRRVIHGPTPYRFVSNRAAATPASLRRGVFACARTGKDLGNVKVAHGE